jgi:hypothetical protein
MFTIERSPLSNDDRPAAFAVLNPIVSLAASLAELEAQAWLLDLRLAAVLIGAARMELRET